VRRAAALALLALLAWGPAAADVVLEGHQHIGDDEGAEFTPRDPVSRSLELANPSHFHLSESLTVTAVVLNDAIDVDDEVDAVIDGIEHASVCPRCALCNGSSSCGDVTLTLTPPVTLAAGFHTLAIDSNSSGNDLGFSAITLVSTKTSASRSFNQRRNVGDDDDEDDDYDIADDDSPWYPDESGGVAVDLPFTLDRNRRLSEIRFYRLRDVDAADAQVLVDGEFVGNLANTGDPLEFDPTSILTSLQLLAGDHTLRVVAGSLGGGNRDTLSWDDIVLVLGNDPSITSGLFTAVDPGGAIDGPITTKTAGAAFSLDLLALSASGQKLDKSYTGVAVVQLLDASSDSGALDDYNCRSSWTLAPNPNLGVVVFTGASNGRKTASFSYAGAVKVARLRITDQASGAYGCSHDAFAIRPYDFSVAVSDAGWESAGTARNLTAASFGASSTPVHKAGQPFTLQATARNAAGATTSGYTGTPSLAVATYPGMGATPGSLTPGSFTTSAGVARTDTARYHEVGAFVLTVTDADFAAVDAADTAAAQRTVSGTANVGRFVPDHFLATAAVPPPEFAPACGTFTYIGQPFRYAVAPSATIVPVTAVAAGEAPTANYTGALYKLPAALTVPADFGYSANHALDFGSMPATDSTLTVAGSVTTVTFDAGTGAQGLSLARALPEVPLEAEILLSRAITDSDGVSGLIQFGGTAPGSGIAFSGGDREMRFGQLRVHHAYGSERLPLPVPLRAEYYAAGDGTPGFTPNPDDSCTAIVSAGDIVIGDAESPAATVAGLTPLSSGNGQASLSAATPRQVTVTANLVTALLPWLQVDDNDPDSNYDDNPGATATFGLYAGTGQRVYTRETFQ